MSAQVDPSPQAESSHSGPPAVARPTAGTEGRNRQKVVAFKVSHVLLSVFFLWLTYLDPCPVEESC